MKIIGSILSRKRRAILFFGLITAFPALSHGAIVTVNIEGLSFVPSTVMINVGDTVTWSGLGDAHNVTGANAADISDFCGASLTSFDTETSCSQTFTTAGTFDYQCTIHAQCCGMIGTVIVSAAAAPPPTVSITNPAPASVFSAPVNLKLGATAALSGGIVTNVAFFANTNGTSVTLGAVQASPFNLTGSSLAAGNYALTAVATAGGVSTTSSVVNISVVTPALLSNSVPAITSKHFTFAYSATVGLTYVIQRSTNLTNWTPVFTNVASTSLSTYSDTSPLAGDNYYRVALQPNP
jgi:plastocyanin